MRQFIRDIKRSLFGTAGGYAQHRIATSLSYGDDVSNTASSIFAEFMAGYMANFSKSCTVDPWLVVAETEGKKVIPNLPGAITTYFFVSLNNKADAAKSQRKPINIANPAEQKKYKTAWTDPLFNLPKDQIVRMKDDAFAMCPQNPAAVNEKTVLYSKFLLLAEHVHGNSGGAVSISANIRNNRFKGSGAQIVRVFEGFDGSVNQLALMFTAFIDEAGEFFSIANLIPESAIFIPLGETIYASEEDAEAGARAINKRGDGYRGVQLMPQPVNSANLHLLNNVSSIAGPQRQLSDGKAQVLSEDLQYAAHV